MPPVTTNRAKQIQRLFCCLAITQTPAAPFIDAGDEAAPLNVTHGLFAVSNGAFPTLTFAFVGGPPVDFTATDNGDGTFTLAGVYPTYAGAVGGSLAYTVTATYQGAGDLVVAGNSVDSTEPGPG